ncbi:MAG TPA: hypothetical protein DEG42_00735 [Acholeplasmataceae bacterium]|nr:MAG: hypothetical protein A2013_04935 [Tenericutes bacterium GWE2_38_8]OHE45409.1 MAG: hypothetical protein A2102_06120 [Tenericutes bacterium GWF2_38_8]HBG33013.1 hypothetical protein [Acholeplasmataceae bacterium]HBY64919.1 hypothetical protein [Acholeplasmataceae bacterium]HCB66429.1 hypothetical protein [Acholeplasmataceae bacterium]
MKKIFITALVYLFGFIFGAIFVYMYYKSEFGVDYGFNIRVFSFVGVPIIYIITSLILDLLIYKNENNRIIKLAGFAALPIFISSFFIAISFDSLRLFSEAVVLWHFILFLPLIVIGGILCICNKFIQKSEKFYVIMKYILTYLLYIYGFFIWFGFGMAGMGV